MIFLFFISFVFASSERIVSLNPTLTEILFSMDLGKNIVGTTTFSNFPEEASQIKTIGSYAKPQLEKIIELKPTHVLAFIEGDPEIVAGLKKAKMPLHAFPSRALDDYPKLITALGDLFQKQLVARKLNEDWSENWNEINKINLNKSIIIQVDHDPIFIAGGDSFLSESFNRCGLKNVFESTKGYKTIQSEALKNLNPSVVLFVGNIPNTNLITEIKTHWKNNPLSRGVPVFVGNADILSRLGPRLPLGVLNFCKEIQSGL